MRSGRLPTRFGMSSLDRWSCSEYACFFQGGANEIMVLGRKRHQRQAVAELGQAHFGNRPLDRDRVGLHEQHLVQLRETRIELSRTRYVTSHGGDAQLVHKPWSHVGSDRNIAMPTQ